MQDDLLFPHLTVKETLTYAALLRLPITLTKNQKKERAMHVINELGLERSVCVTINPCNVKHSSFTIRVLIYILVFRCQDTIIGGTFVRGVSGGERKRVCIGNEILLNPSLLFLDEPTSGLDSTAAFRVLQMLHIIAEVLHGIGILCLNSNILIGYMHMITTTKKVRCGLCLCILGWKNSGDYNTSTIK